ncbi:hypothetical protein VPHF99_0114 [Vibrio phage F99]|nr:hypothetical protein MYOV085v1_p0030 [Vibrio phage 355E48.1]
MKLKTNLLIPEEEFSRKFAKELIRTLRTNKDLGVVKFSITLISESKIHWTGGKAYATNTEFLMAKKITRQLLRYSSFPYQTKLTKYVTDGIEFASDGRFTPEFPF